MVRRDIQERIAKWLIRIGKERSTAWACFVKLRGEDPFANMLLKAFLSPGWGDAFAGAKLAEIEFRARRAGKSIFEFLNEQDQKGQLDKLMDEIGITHEMIRSAVRGLLMLARELGLSAKRLDRSAMAQLYERLRDVRGIGEKLRHFIIYDLIRLYDFPPPENLGPHEQLLEKLRLLGISEPEKLFRPEDWPYVDAALWDL